MINAHKIPIGEGLITSLDLSEYWGQRNATIRVATRGGYRDYAVKVAVKDVLGVILEQGLATWDSGSGCWTYLTSADVPLGEIWILTATAGNPQAQTTREAVCVPVTVRFETEFKSNALARASDLGRWKNN